MSLKQLEDMVSAWLFHDTLPTPESIRMQINQIRSLPMFAAITDDDAEKLAKEL